MREGGRGREGGREVKVMFVFLFCRHAMEVERSLFRESSTGKELRHLTVQGKYILIRNKGLI